MIREIVRRKKLEDQLKNGGGGLSEPPVQSRRDDVEIANDRQRELRQLLAGGLGNAPELAGDPFEDASAFGVDP